ncbi:MAG: hypothetical protein QM756_03770 [Polyangiaceae bacterium]
MNWIPLPKPEIGTALALPVFLMARFGRHASRYGDSTFSFAAGAGATLLTFNTGQPVADSGTFVQPVVKLELGFSSYKVGFATALGYHDNFSSDSAPLRVGYRTQLITFSFINQPDPED